MFKIHLPSRVVFSSWLNGSKIFGRFVPVSMDKTSPEKTPSACDDPRHTGFPCFGGHKDGKMRSNQFATLTLCTRCGLRTTYVVKKAGHGQTRQMGPDPQIIRLALSSLEKNTRPEEMSADVVNGKIMEIKGTMLQMGLKTPMALNLTLKEYEDRLEKFGRADGKPVSPKRETEAKGDKKTSPREPSPSTTVPGSPSVLKEEIAQMAGYKAKKEMMAALSRSSPSTAAPSAGPTMNGEHLPVVDITSEDELMPMKDDKSKEPVA